MRRPSPTILLLIAFLGWLLFPDSILDGWVNVVLFWATLVGAIAYTAYLRRA